MIFLDEALKDDAADAQLAHPTVDLRG